MRAAGLCGGGALPESTTEAISSRSSGATPSRPFSRPAAAIGRFRTIRPPATHRDQAPQRPWPADGRDRRGRGGAQKATELKRQELSAGMTWFRVQILSALSPRADAKPR